MNYSGPQGYLEHFLKKKENKILKHTYTLAHPIQFYGIIYK